MRLCTSQVPALILTLIGIMSLGFIAITDRFFFKLFESVYAPLAILADLRLTSLLIIVTTYVWIKRIYSIRSKPRVKGLKHAILLSICWLMVTAYFVLIKEVWVPQLKDWVDYVAFMMTGLIGEEILFRGILFDLSIKVFGEKTFLSFSAPVFWSSILFGFQHLAYHGFALNTASMTQVTYILVMGIVFARIKENTGSLWAVIALHMVSNSFTLIRNFP